MDLPPNQLAPGGGRKWARGFRPLSTSMLKRALLIASPWRRIWVASSALPHAIRFRTNCAHDARVESESLVVLAGEGGGGTPSRVETYLSFWGHAITMRAFRQ